MCGPTPWKRGKERMSSGKSMRWKNEHVQIPGIMYSDEGDRPPRGSKSQHYEQFF